MIAASRYIYAASQYIEIPLGLGSRHIAAASVTYNTNAIAIVVSESSIVRIVADGKIITDIIPELWLIQKTQLEDKSMEQKEIEHEIDNSPDIARD